MTDEKLYDGFIELENVITKALKHIKKIPHQFIDMELYYHYDNWRGDFEFNPWLTDLKLILEGGSE